MSRLRKNACHHSDIFPCPKPPTHEYTRDGKTRPLCENHAAEWQAWVDDEIADLRVQEPRPLARLDLGAA